jgi:LPS export ABC transporter protein LptC
MRENKRNFIIFDRHRRLKRLWQFFFTGWGLIMIAALAAGVLFSRQLLWTPIAAINMKEITSNQFKMSNASFSGVDRGGNPFKIRAISARQEYDNPNIIFVEKINATAVRVSDGKKITDVITANTGRYNRNTKSITLNGNVRVDSSNGDKILTDELVVQL